MRKINQKYSSATESNRRTQEDKNRKKQKKKFETTIQLSPDSGTIVNHGLMIRKFTRIVARRTDDSTLYKIDYKPVDYARIRINNRDSVELKNSSIHQYYRVRRRLSGTGAILIPGFCPADPARGETIQPWPTPILLDGGVPPSAPGPGRAGLVEVRGRRRDQRVAPRRAPRRSDNHPPTLPPPGEHPPPQGFRFFDFSITLVA